MPWADDINLCSPRLVVEDVTDRRAGTVGEFLLNAKHPAAVCGNDFQRRLPSPFDFMRGSRIIKIQRHGGGDPAAEMVNVGLYFSSGFPGGEFIHRGMVFSG